VKIFTDPAHVILLAAVVAIVLAIYLVSRRRRNAGRNLDHLDSDDHQHPPGHGHQRRPGHDHQHGAGHGAADPERHHL